jgi:hypothetical protein
MVHLHHTGAADATVMCSGGLYHVAVFAPAKDHEILKSIIMLALIFLTNGSVDSSFS